MKFKHGDEVLARGVRGVVQAVIGPHPTLYLVSILITCTGKRSLSWHLENDVRLVPPLVQLAEVAE